MQTAACSLVLSSNEGTVSEAEVNQKLTLARVMQARGIVNTVGRTGRVLIRLVQDVPHRAGVERLHNGQG